MLSPFASLSPFSRPRFVASGGGGSLPQLAHLKFDIDPSQIAGLSDGDPVSALSDQSGNGNDPTVTGSFLYKTPILNGLPVIRTDSGSYMTLPDFSSWTAATMIFVFKNASSGDSIYQLAESSTDPKSYLPYVGGGSYDSFFSTVRKEAFDSGITTSWNVYTVRSAAGDWTAHVGGALKHTTGTNTVSAPSAGRIAAVVGGPWSGGSGGDIARILIWDIALNGTDRANAESIISTLYGL